MLSHFVASRLASATLAPLALSTRAYSARASHDTIPSRHYSEVTGRPRGRVGPDAPTIVTVTMKQIRLVDN